MTARVESAALWWLLGVTLLVCVVSDLKWRRIPDLVTWPALVASLVLRLVLLGPGDLGHGLLTGVLGAALAVTLFGALAVARRGVGWGDVKLLGVVGAALGLELGMAALLFTSLAGAVQALAAVLWRGDTNSARTPRHIPYGVAIAVGSAWAMWWGRSTLN